MIDPNEVADIIRDVAAREIMPRYGQLAASEIGTKTGPSDFVTEADIAAEKSLRAGLTRLLPGAGFVGEESYTHSEAEQAALADAEAYWIVDPIDGTRNFVQGRKEFGSIVALVVGGVIQIWLDLRNPR